MFPDCCGTLGNPEIGRVTENARAVTGTIVNSPARYFIFPIPMPCLPVQVSDIRSARRSRPLGKAAGRVQLRGILRVDHTEDMEIPVSCMTNHCCGK